MKPVVSYNDSVAGAYRQTPVVNSKHHANQTQFINTLDHVTNNVDDIPANDNSFYPSTPAQHLVSQLRHRSHSAPSESSTQVDMDIVHAHTSDPVHPSQNSDISISENEAMEGHVMPRTASPTPSETSNTGCCLLKMQTDTAEIAAESNSKRARRYGKNLGLTLTRNMLSVAVPTAVREYMRRSGLPAIFATLPKYAAPCAGALALGLPVISVLTALVRDFINGTQTKESVISQLALLSFNVVAGVLLIKSGGFTDAIDALVAAVFIYVTLRTFVQVIVKLSDNNPAGFSVKSTLLAAGCYAVNQTIVDKCMDLSSESLAPYMEGLTAHIAGRSVVNMIGESIDELCFRSLYAWLTNNPRLELKLEFFSRENMTWEKIKGTMFNTLSSCASLFSSGFAFGFAKIAPSIPDCVKTGMSLGAGYAPFVFAHAQKTKSPEQPHDIKLGVFSLSEEEYSADGLAQRPGG